MARYSPNPSLQSLRGSIDGLTLRGDGTALARSRPRNPKTPLQRGVRERMRIVGGVWDSVTPEEAQGWWRYAELVDAMGGRSAGARPARAYDVFSGLGLKLLQIHGGTTVPTAAPEGLFFGDATVVRAEAVPGGVRFRANGPNGPDALTELLLQPLKRAANRPQLDKYRTRAFVAFGEAGLEAVVEAKPGAYAVAVRYVLASTGQASRLVPLSLVVVPKG